MSARTELRPPFEPPAEETSVYGGWFVAGAILGWAMIAFGVWSLLVRPGATDPPAVAVWIVGLALVNDLVLVPLALLVGALARRTVPRLARGLVLGALAVSAFVLLYALPFARRYGAQPDNPSFLPRDTGFWVIVVLALVWFVAAAMLLVRMRARGARR